MPAELGGWREIPHNGSASDRFGGRLLGADLAETAAALVAAHRNGTLSPEETVARSYQRIRAHNDPAIFITLRDEAEALAEARALAQAHDPSLPLYGVPVAVKDNIDVAGLPTTAACPAFSYRPARDATAVARLRAAGAIVIGKTNLDQFATGLNGTRSPYGTPRNAYNASLIPGGSSSGSAVAVAAGLALPAMRFDAEDAGFAEQHLLMSHRRLGEGSRRLGEVARILRE